MFVATVPKLLLFGAFALIVLCSPAVRPSGLVARLTDADGTHDGDSPDDLESPAMLLRRQMLNPSEILSVLQIIGGDVIQKAIAQLSGTRLGFTPVAFSFGWVAYTFNAVMAVFGDGILMPRPEDEVVVVNLQSGTKKRNESWVLWRLVRDQVQIVVNLDRSGLSIVRHLRQGLTVDDPATERGDRLASRNRLKRERAPALVARGTGLSLGVEPVDVHALQFLSP